VLSITKSCLQWIVSVEKGLCEKALMEFYPPFFADMLKNADFCQQWLVSAEKENPFKNPVKIL
jgi:hypothetical protein